MKQRQDERTGRVWLKVQLRPDAESQHTLDVVQYWKNGRSATASVNKAIAIYYALQSGNIEPLFKEFPMLRAMLQSGATPAPAPAPATAEPLKKREQLQTQAEENDDFLSSLGL